MTPLAALVAALVAPSYACGGPVFHQACGAWIADAKNCTASAQPTRSHCERLLRLRERAGQMASRAGLSGLRIFDHLIMDPVVDMYFFQDHNQLGVSQGWLERLGEDAEAANGWIAHELGHAQQKAMGQSLPAKGTTRSVRYEAWADALGQLILLKGGYPTSAMSAAWGHHMFKGATHSSSHPMFEVRRHNAGLIAEAFRRGTARVREPRGGIMGRLDAQRPRNLDAAAAEGAGLDVSRPFQLEDFDEHGFLSLDARTRRR